MTKIKNKYFKITILLYEIESCGHFQSFIREKIFDSNIKSIPTNFVENNRLID